MTSTARAVSSAGGAARRYELRMVLLVVALVLVGVPFGALLQQVATDGPLTALDESAARSLNRRVQGEDSVIAAMEAVSFLGRPGSLAVVVGVAALWLLRRGATRTVVFLVATTAGGGLVNSLVKLAVGRPRPEVEEPVAEAFGRSFPSGHSMGSFVCFGALVVAFAPQLPDRARRATLAAAALLVLGIGASRLVLGVHYLSDVAGGYVLGAAWLAGSVAAFETWRADRGRRRTHPIEEGVEPEEAADRSPS